MEDLINDIKKEEGWSGTVYKCSLGYDTAMFGTRLPFSKEEGDLILRHRLDLMMHELLLKKPNILELPKEKLSILFNMCYQMGVPRLLKFKKMFKALESGDYKLASIEMMDSLWAKQTPNRAKRLSERMRL